MGSFMDYCRCLLLGSQIGKATKARTIVKTDVDSAKATEPLGGKRIAAANPASAVYFTFETQAFLKRLADAE